MPPVPPSPPGPVPLPVDRVAIEAAIAACLRAIRLIGALTEARAHAGAIARGEWRGPTRERFDRSTARLDAEADELVARILATVRRLREQLR